MSGDFIERLVAGQLLSRMTELEAELAAERAANGRLRAEVAVLRADLAAVTTEYKAERRLADNLVVRLTEEASRER